MEEAQSASLIRQRMLPEARLRHVPAGQFIVRQGIEPLDVFFLESGVLKMTDISKLGKEKVLHLLRPGAVVPLAFFSGPEHSAHWSYVALTDCDMYALPCERLTALMHADSDLALVLMHWFSLEVHELLVRLSSLEYSDVQAKLLAALRFLAAYHARPLRRGWRRVNFPVSHQLLAALTGVRRESVTVSLGRLERQDIVSTAEFTTLDIHHDLLQS